VVAVTTGALGVPALLLVGELLGADAADLAGQQWRTEAALVELRKLRARGDVR
jgi:hypothetical protein